MSGKKRSILSVTLDGKQGPLRCETYDVSPSPVMRSHFQSCNDSNSANFGAMPSCHVYIIL